MFRCQKCNAVVPAGVSGQKVVTQTRQKEYEQREAESAPRRRFGRSYGHRRPRVIDRGGSGQEIVREIMVCPQCAEALSKAAAP